MLSPSARDLDFDRRRRAIGGRCLRTDSIVRLHSARRFRGSRVRLRLSILAGPAFVDDDEQVPGRRSAAPGRPAAGRFAPGIMRLTMRLPLAAEPSPPCRPAFRWKCRAPSKPGDAASIAPCPSTKATKCPASLKPPIARSAISRSLRAPPVAAGTASRIAVSPSGSVTRARQERHRAAGHARRQAHHDRPVAADRGKAPGRRDLPLRRKAELRPKRR